MAGFLLECVAGFVGNRMSPLLRDAMLAAVLTGTRIDELCSIRAGDVALTGNVPTIDIKGSKTEAARRIVPVHPDLVAHVIAFGGIV